MSAYTRSHCGTKHCPAMIVMLYELTEENTGSFTRKYGIPQGTIDKLRKKGRLKTKGRRRQLCAALVVMLYQLTDDTVRDIAKAVHVNHARISDELHGQGVSIHNKTQERKALERFNDKTPEGVEAIGYEGRYVDLICHVCGCTYRRYRDQGTTYACPECRSKAEAEARAQRDAERLRAKQQRREELEARACDELTKEKTCIECGAVFHSECPYAMYCSTECRGKARNRRKTQSRRERGMLSGVRHRRRARERGVEYERGITLHKLIERDRGVCQICGEPVDIGDRAWGSAGPRYPSIDHVVAIANGGSHTWDNVQLAHCMCNSVKRDLPAKTA